MESPTITDWVTAIGTSGALLTAVILIGIEIRRSVRSHREVVRSQARLVSGWADRTQAGHDHKEGFRARALFVVRNGSPEPVYDLVVRPVGPGVGTGVNVSRKLRRLIPPEEEITLGTWDLAKAPVGTDLKFSVRDARLELLFRDAGGRCWRRSGNGELSEIEPSELERHAPPIPDE